MRKARVALYHWREVVCSPRAKALPALERLVKEKVSAPPM